MAFICSRCQREVPLGASRGWLQVIPRDTATCNCGASFKVHATTFAWWTAVGMTKILVLPAIAAVAASLWFVSDEYKRNIGILATYSVLAGLIAAPIVGLTFGSSIGFLIAAAKRLYFGGNGWVNMLFCAGLSLGILFVVYSQVMRFLPTE